MKEMTIQESMNVNGGKTYYCPFGCNKRGSYGSVYTHCLSNGCFKKDPWLNWLWSSARWCFDAALEIQVTKFLGNLFFPTGKHFK